jgi:hypothetical protein
MQLI